MFETAPANRSSVASAAAPSASAKTSTRQYDLDLFRFVAAMAVVFYHFTFRGLAADDGAMVTDFGGIGAVAKYGYLGVNFFFMISGYVILMSALGRSVTEFFISRVSRLYPAFWGALILTTVVSLALSGDGIFAVTMPQFLANLTMAPGLFGQIDIDSAYWSLFVELKFYAIIAVLIVTGMLRRVDAVLAVWTVAMVAIAFADPLVPFRVSRLIDFVVFPRYTHYFIAGALFFLVKTRGASLLRLGLLGANFVLAVRWSRIEARRLGDIFAVDYSMFVTVGFVALFFAVFAMVAFERTQWLQRKEFMALGALTYTVYLVHQHIGYLLLNELDGVMNKWLALTLVLGVVLGLAKLLSASIEVPAGKALRTGLTNRLVPGPAARLGAASHDDQGARSEDQAAA